MPSVRLIVDSGEMCVCVCVLHQESNVDKLLDKKTLACVAMLIFVPNVLNTM